MTNWQVTATTLYCAEVDDEVTIMVYKDWSTKCASFKKYHEPDRETLRLLKKRAKQLKRELGCTGPECPQVLRYKEKLLAEESQKKSR